MRECAAIPDTHYHRYSLQCSLYAEMLAYSYRIDVGDRLYLVRMHADRVSYEIVRCCNWRSVATQVLAAEHRRLLNARLEG